MDGVRGVFAGVAMGLGLLVACVGLALKVVDDTAWALTLAGVVCLVLGALVTQAGSSPLPSTGREPTDHTSGSATG